MSSWVCPTGSLVKRISRIGVFETSSSLIAKQYLLAFSDPPSTCQYIFSGNLPPWFVFQSSSWHKKQYILKFAPIYIKDFLCIHFKENRINNDYNILKCAPSVRFSKHL